VEWGSGPGRGAYICPSRDCLREALKRNELARRLRAPLASIEVETLERSIRERMTRKVLSLLGLARRARKVVSGAAGVESSIRRGAAHVVLTSADAPLATAKRIQRLASAAGIPCHRALSAAELGAAVGSAPRASVAVIDPHLAAAIASVLATIPVERPRGTVPGDETITPEAQHASRSGWR
jgi:hypothetical protein